MALLPSAPVQLLKLAVKVYAAEAPHGNITSLSCASQSPPSRKGIRDGRGGTKDK